MDHPFQRGQREWATGIIAASAPEWNLPLKEMPVEPTRRARGVETSSDIFWALHRRCGIPIITEASRHILITNLASSKEDLGRYLRSWSSGLGTFHLEGRALPCRPGEFWRSRPTEPPEAALAPFERVPIMTLDSLAALYADSPPAAVSEGFAGLMPFASVHDLDLAPRFGLDVDPAPTLRRSDSGGD